MRCRQRQLSVVTSPPVGSAANGFALCSRCGVHGTKGVRRNGSLDNRVKRRQRNRKFMLDERISE